MVALCALNTQRKRTRKEHCLIIAILIPKTVLTFATCWAKSLKSFKWFSTRNVGAIDSFRSFMDFSLIVLVSCERLLQLLSVTHSDY